MWTTLLWHFLYGFLTSITRELSVGGQQFEPNMHYVAVSLVGGMHKGLDFQVVLF